jgi:hypothetical protein
LNLKVLVARSEGFLKGWNLRARRRNLNAIRMFVQLRMGNLLMGGCARDLKDVVVVLAHLLEFITI